VKAEFAASKSRPPTRRAGSLTTKPLNMGGELGNRRELDTMALIELVDTHPCQPAKGCDFLGIFRLSLLKQSQAGTHDFTGIAVSTCCDLIRDKVVKGLGQIDVSSWHDAPRSGNAACPCLQRA